MVVMFLTRRATKNTDTRNKSLNVRILFDGEEKTPPELMNRVDERIKWTKTKPIHPVPAALVIKPNERKESKRVAKNL